MCECIIEDRRKRMCEIIVYTSINTYPQTLKLTVENVIYKIHQCYNNTNIQTLRNISFIILRNHRLIVFFI